MKRPLLIIAICLLLGAVVNVAVAWGLAASVNPFLSEQEVSRTDEWSVVHLKRAGVAYSTRHPHRVAGRSVDAPGVQIVATAGWPLICSWYEYSFSIDGFGPIEGGLELGLEPWSAPSPGGGGLWPKALPLRPIWPGFVINTIFYAAILWLLIPGPFVLRRFVRVRRGLCPRCAYPIGESSVCTECATPLPKHAVAKACVGARLREGIKPSPTSRIANRFVS